METPIQGVFCCQKSMFFALTGTRIGRIPKICIMSIKRKKF